MKKSLKVPQFKNKDEEWEFWSNLDLSEYFEPKDFKRVSFPNLKPSTNTISIRLPEPLLNRIKTSANRQDVPYQSYIKTVLDKAVKWNNEIFR